MRCAVLGDPIDHSLSPVLHRAGYDAAGLDWDYAAHRVAEGTLTDFLDALDARWRGLSLTMPLKREAMELVADASATARAAGAANTLVIEPNGHRRLDNTDVTGATRVLRETVSSVESVVILGGGATAVSMGLAAAELGASRIRVAVREKDRARDTVRRLRKKVEKVKASKLGSTSVWDADLVISTIPAAAQTKALVRRTANCRALFDVIYDPWPTPLAAAFSDRIVLGGLDLLVAQAVDQFQIFTGVEAPVEAMRAAGEAALAARTP